MKPSKPRDYCCCAIPLVNAGVYATLIEQTAAGLLIGTLSIATPESMCIHHFNEAPVTNQFHSHSCWRLYLLGCEVDPRNLSLFCCWRTALGFHWCLKGKFSPTVQVPLIMIHLYRRILLFTADTSHCMDYVHPLHFLWLLRG